MPCYYTFYVEINLSIYLQQTSKYNGLVLVNAVSLVMIRTENSVFILLEKAQIIGTLAWGITVHIANGSTYAEIIADMTFVPNRKTAYLVKCLVKQNTYED